MIGELESDLFGRVIDPSNPTLTRAAAEALLSRGYAEADHARMAELAAESGGGTLKPAERRERESYVFVGDVLSMLKAKTRPSLRKHAPAA